MLDQGVEPCVGAREVAIRVNLMELVSAINDVVELVVELGAELGVETFVLTPSPCLQRGSEKEAVRTSSSLMSSLSDASSRQLAFNKEWRRAKRS